MGKTIIFDTKGNSKQLEVAELWADDDSTDILYGGSKGSAKSYTGCSLICGDSLTYPGTFYFIARKSLTDLIRYTIPSIMEVFDHWGITREYWKFNGQYNFFELYNKSRIYLIDAAYKPSDKEYTRFGSMQMTRGWIEEGGEFNINAKNNLQASIGRWKNDEYGLIGKLLITCNPSNNFLFTEYYKPWKDGKLPKWRKFVQALPSDNKMLPKGYIENLLRILTPSQIARLVYGEWEYDDDPTWLVDYDAICDLFTNDHVEEGDENDRYLTTDLAGKGRDSWVVGTWRKLVLRIPVCKGFSEGKEMEQKIKKLATLTKTPHSHIVSDADGLGFYLESYMKNIKEFHGNARPINSQYGNLKDECGFKLAELINKRRIKIICSPEMQEIIKLDLTVLRCESTNNTDLKKKLIKKNKMKELIGKSPDFLDILLMRMIFEIVPEASGINFTPLELPKKR